MKLKVRKDVLLDALQKVASVITTRATIPSMANIMFQAEKDKLWLQATDLDVSIRTFVTADITRTGATTLPARRVLAITRESAADELEIEVSEKDIATIRTGASVFKLHGLPEDDFPPMPKYEGGTTYTLDQGQLLEMLKNTFYSASKDESRAILRSVLLSFKNDKLTVVATDGRRMALYENDVEFPKNFEADVILPQKAVSELIRTLQHEGGALKIQSTGKQVAVEYNDLLLVSLLVEGTYPNFRQVIPNQSAERIAINREDFLAALRRVSIMVTEQNSSVTLTFAKNRLDVAVIAPSTGEARETLAIKYTGSPLTISFNPEFLMDPLKNLVGDEVYLELTDDMSPGVIKSNVPFLYVLMPMKVN